MGNIIEVVGFDADDTLWHNETFFKMTEARFAELLADYADSAHLIDRLFEIERRNLGHYGFGIKGFMLSMIETALEVTEGRVGGDVVAQILEIGQEMLRHPVELLPHVEETLARVADRYPLVLITKGDLLHQEQKLAASGLGEMFRGVEIVSDKTPPVYARAFADHGGAARAVMVGNSMKSDILPALEAGAWAVYVPHEVGWAFEAADAPEGHPRYAELPDLAPLPGLLDRIA